MPKNQLLNQSGMTLVETMVAASLLAGLAVAGMTLFKNQSTGQKTVEANYEITNLFQQIRVVLSAQGNCTDSLGGKNFTSDTTITRLRKDVSGTFTDVFQVNTPISGTLVKVTSYTLEKTAGTGLASNETWLKINFNKGKSTLMENSTKMLKIVYTTSGPNIGTCYAYNNSTDSYWLQGTPPDIYFTAGNVGIGTTSPVSRLHVEGTDPAMIRLTTTGNANRFNISTSAAAGTLSLQSAVPMTFNTSATERMRIDSSGNIGIGTTAPTQKVHIISNVQFSGVGIATSSNPVVGISGQAVGGDNGALGLYNAGSAAAYFVASGNSYLTGGNLGVGTNGPTQRLHVSGNTLTTAETYTGGWFRSTSSNAGWYHEVHGGGWYMVDNTWIRSYGGKSIYHDTGFMRTDGTLQVGGGGATLSVANGGDFSYVGGTLFANQAGNVGVGLTNPSFKLDVASGGGGTAVRIRGGGDFQMDPQVSGPPSIMYNDVGIMQFSTGVSVSGDITASNVWSGSGFWYTSDARLKKDVTAYEGGLEKLLRLETVRFTWKDSGKKDAGFIAQEVKKVDPELVHETANKEKTLTIKLQAFLPMIVNAIQELFDLITGTRAEVAELRKENLELKARLDRQDAILKRLEERTSARP